MAQKSLREFDAKKILVHNLGNLSNGEHTFDDRLLQVNQKLLAEQSAFDILAQNPWLGETKLVVKPDQLIKRRGNAGLLLLNADWPTAHAFISERMAKEVVIEGVPGIIDHFLVEPFYPHEQKEEMYVSISSSRDIDTVLFYHAGGVDIGDVDAKAERLEVATTHKPTVAEITKALLNNIPADQRELVATFIQSLFRLFRELHFTLIEINPLVVKDGSCRPLDIAAKLDECGHFLCEDRWAGVTFPAPFGRAPAPDEAYIKDLDAKTGASLKLTLLNQKGRIWTMVAGGGASVVYADTISDLGFSSELANYGEYSGAPSEAFTYEYAKTVLKLLTAGEPRLPDGKVLIIGGGIANFTDIAATFKGIVHALKDYAEALRTHQVKIWVRRGGPNYVEGLRMMKECGEAIKVPMQVFGPDTDIVDIVPMGLGAETAAIDFNTIVNAPRTEVAPAKETVALLAAKEKSLNARADNSYRFTENTRCIIYGLQRRACQGMLDFDFICKRKKPSVAAFVFPFSGNHFQKFYFGTKEVLIPVFQKMEDALAKNPDVDIMINFASFRSVHASTMEALSHPQLRCVAIIAEGVPEVHTREIIATANKKDVMIIGPATVGGIKPGKFRIGNTGGFLDNIISSKLYRAGSVGYVSKSGGMSNELNSIISKNTNGVFEGVAIGGDRYPGTRFIDHLLRFNDDPDCKILVLLGEVGGIDEYEVVAAMRSGRITKPVIAWCIGTCAKLFPYEVQFGHAGALAQGNLDTSDAKNKALAAAGAYVPRSFADMGPLLKALYTKLVKEGTIIPAEEGPVPTMPIDYATAKKSGLIRKPSSFISTICDDRGEELLYAGVPVSQVFKEDLGVGGVVSLLWFRRRLPIYATKFIEMIMMVTADHGPAVSGAHNTIVCARAAKDLISSLCSGLLTIGPRFGGALDEAARMFSEALDNGWTPAQFIKETRKRGKLIMGIGHKIKSVTNPDMRVTIMVAYVKKHFARHPVLDYALEVQKLTTKKKANLILNVDGAIACAFVDLIRECGMFEREEGAEIIASGCLNGLFVLGRSIGFIGHYLDQKRLKQGLYRHPWDDISYAEDPNA